MERLIFLPDLRSFYTVILSLPLGLLMVRPHRLYHLLQLVDLLAPQEVLLRLLFQGPHPLLLVVGFSFQLGDANLGLFKLSLQGAPIINLDLRCL